MTEARRMTEEAIAKLRTKLLDLSKKNALISFKHTGRGAGMLRVVDERPDLLCAAIEKGPVGFEPLPGEDETPLDERTPTFQIAYKSARLTDETFLAATESLGDDEADAKAWQEAERTLRAAVRRQLGLPKLDYGKTIDIAAIARAHGFDPSYELKPSDDGDVADHHNDDRLRVLLTAKELETRLKAIWERYHGHARETGIETLFLAIGFVEWRDDAAPESALHAPLLLLPVKLDRKIVRSRYEYQLSRHDDSLKVNVALDEKMRRDWGLKLPALRSEETPESYFVRTREVLARGNRLALRWFVTLAVLPPTILWEDLDPEMWSEAAFARHRLLPGLLGAAAVAGDTAPATSIDIDAPEWVARAPALIRPADASQHSALIDMAEGHDLAIEGPPGTGKSEIITNMIATALAAGKRVLFVAEKQAALRVVADRLRASGFGALLLELHGDNANRTTVYDGLRARLKATVAHDPTALALQRTQLNASRALLRRYMALIETPLGRLGRSAYWLAWREIGLRESLGRDTVDAMSARWQPSDVRAIDRAALANHRASLDTFAGALIALDRDRPDGVRTRWTLATRLDPFDQRSELVAAADAGKAALGMQSASEAFARCASLAMPGSDGAIGATADQLAGLVPFDATDERIARAALRHPDTARALLRQQMRWRQLCVGLADDVADAGVISEEAVAALAAALRAVRPTPLTVGLARERLDAVRSAADASARTEADMRFVIERLGIEMTLKVDDVRRALNAVSALAAEPATVAVLYRADLLDPLAETVLQGEATRAAALRFERDALSADATDDAMTADAADLNRTADVLVDSGFFARLFGSEYKAARRHAERLALKFSDRLAAAELLRKIARHHIQATSFKNDSAIAAWFPTLLWKGADSDLNAIMRARMLLVGARRELADASAHAVLSRWLALSGDERSRLDAAIGRVRPMLSMASEAGFADQPIGTIDTALSSTLRSHETVAAALAGVAVKPDGMIIREGENLADWLSALHTAAAEFTNLCARDEYQWVGKVVETLEPLARALTQADALRSNDGPLGIAARLRASDTPVALLEAIIVAGATWREAAGAWQTAGRDLSGATGLASATLETDWQRLADTLQAMAGDEVGARLSADLLKYGRALDDAALAPFGAAALDGIAAATQLADLYELLFTRELLRDYLGGDGADLGRTGGLALAEARRSFARIDAELHALEAKAIVAVRLGDKPPRGIGHGPKGQHTEMELLDGELALKRPRTPIRDVVHRAGAAMQALKPVWMMSPTSAAQYIRPGTLDFDLLVVDEASQMRPEYALSAILRGQQFVVVGDANQLPPSNHFQTSADDGTEDEGAGIAEGTESILDLANQRFRRKRRLKWHYRSQHESLIQFSNREFYQRDLVVFPSPMGNDDELLGLKCRYVRGAVYESSINQREAEEVIQEAFRLMRAYPQHSIGIAAMNAKQTELIQNEFDRLTLEQPEIARYVAEYLGGVDEFFIKNLENVQGDERDIILISTVYGPGKDGRVLQNFGLMNREVGWRRLNVLVTRAKLSTRLFTSLRPDDVKLTPSSSRGVKAFRAYLTYAHQGAAYDDAAGGEPDSDFEVFVADRLREAGYEIVHQVGVEGFRIDLGVRHADYPLGFIAGIECDGASFHSGLSIRDRDRIRQSVLENMGWKIYRIWSTDWFADPSRQMGKLLAYLDTSRANYADEFAHRPKPAPEVSTPAQEPAEQIIAVAATPAQPEVRSEPQGQRQRPLDGIEWYARSNEQLYDIWVEGVFVGEVEVLARALGAPKLYGDQLVVARSEYEGRIHRSGETFRTADIYAAVREVARRGSKD